MFSSNDHKHFTIIAYTGLCLACVGVLSILGLISYGIYRLF